MHPTVCLQMIKGIGQNKLLCDFVKLLRRLVPSETHGGLWVNLMGYQLQEIQSKQTRNWLTEQPETSFLLPC